MKKIILIIGCLVLSVMLLFIFIASLGGLFAENKELGIAVPLLVISVFGFLLVFAIAKKHIFNRKGDKDAHQIKSSDSDDEKLYTYEDIVRKVVGDSDLIEDLFKEKVIDYQLKFENHNRVNAREYPFGDDNDQLDEDEVEELGLNPRMGYPRHLAFVLTDKGIHYGNKNPKGILVFAALAASNLINLQRDIVRAKDLGISKMEIMPAGDERDCEWCRVMNGKIVPIGVSFIDDILDSCTCDYPRIVVKPQINI